MKNNNKLSIGTALLLGFSSTTFAIDFNPLKGNELYGVMGISQLSFTATESNGDSDNLGAFIKVGKHFTKNISVEARYFKNLNKQDLTGYFGYPRGLETSHLLSQTSA